jgi:hypothetical protein
VPEGQVVRQGSSGHDQEQGEAVWFGARLCKGPDMFQEDLALVVEKHGENCGEVLQFEKGENCLLRICYACDFCHTLGGF